MRKELAKRGGRPARTVANSSWPEINYMIDVDIVTFESILTRSALVKYNFIQAYSPQQSSSALAKV